MDKIREKEVNCDKHGLGFLNSSSSQQTRQGLFVLVIFVMAVSIGLLVFEGISEYNVTLTAAQHNLSGYAAIVKENYDKNLRVADLLLRRVTWDITRQGGIDRLTEKELCAIFSQMGSGLPETSVVFVADKAGHVIACNYGYPAPVVTVTDRDYFTSHQRKLTDDTYLGRIVADRLNGQPRYTLSRRLNDKQGNFAGVAVLTMDADALNTNHLTFNYGSNIRVLLLRFDGVIAAMSPPDLARADSFDFSQTLLFTQQLSVRPAGFFRDKKALYDLTDRFVAFDTLTDFPAIVVVSQSAEEVVAPQKRRIAVFGASGAGFLLLVFSLMRFLLRRLKEEEKLNKRVETEIRHMAYFDALTGLPNRANLNERLAEETLRARQTGDAVTIFFIDFDDFKTVNDVFGHSYGDKVVQAAANHLVELVSDGAYVARIGGDEFIVVLPGKKDRTETAALADDVINALNREYPAGESVFQMTASIGIAIYPEDGDTVEEILKNADSALYAAKGSGKNQWRFYEDIMQAEAQTRMVLTNSLRRAIERNELTLHYQPKVTTAGDVQGFEALLRWNSQEHGALPPLKFIPLAETTGLIVPIGAWVIREACRFAGRLAKMGKGEITIAVNISPRQLATDGFVDIVQDIIEEAGINPSQLEFEITESVLLISPEESIRKLEQLKARGIHITLDDFGTGYSSLTYLRRLPVETLKIDKAFIDTIGEDVTQAAFIGSIVDMASILDIQVVAEGVETKRQYEYVKHCRCGLVQGYYISRPVPEDAAVSFLRTGDQPGL